MSRTPLPWKVVSAAACAEIEVFEIAEVSEMRVIPAAGGWPIAGTPEEDAAFIVRACNSHYELLEALRDMLGGWKYIRSFHGDLYGVGWDRAQGKAEAAIAAAGDKA